MVETGLEGLSAEVERDLKGYNEAFVQANRDDDPSLMRLWMRLPLMRFGNGSVAEVATPQAVDAMYGRMVDGLKGTGYVRSVLSDFHVDVLNPTTALVRCHAVRERADGSVIEAFEAAYLMARAEDRWQVACLISRR
ncbi:MAG: hypothetical protein O3B31_06735 [Chloroflexi bacterium]|nr:hypothetical protein [Chloroflexota bacterium]MDA1003029.1 hypothetical protein [Chloroflexota bacterium]